MPIVHGITYPVTNLFKLRTAAIFALVPMNTTLLMRGRSCGVSSGELVNAITSGAFNNRTLERLDLVLGKYGQTDRTLMFLQTSP